MVKLTNVDELLIPFRSFFCSLTLQLFVPRNFLKLLLFLKNLKGVRIISYMWTFLLLHLWRQNSQLVAVILNGARYVYDHGVEVFRFRTTLMPPFCSSYEQNSNVFLFQCTLRFFYRLRMKIDILWGRSAVIKVYGINHVVFITCTLAYRRELIGAISTRCSH